MSCPSFAFSALGRQGIGVNQPQSGLDYPFVSPTSTNPGDANDIRFLIADFYLAYDDPGLYNPLAPIAKHPLRIKWLYGVGCAASSAPAWAPTPVHEADIIVVDDNNVIVFNSTALVPVNGDPEFRRFVKRSWSNDYDIYEWTGNNAVCRIVAYKTWPTAFEIEPRNWPTHIVPYNATLDERAVHKMPRRLRTLKVVADDVLVGPVIRTGTVVFEANYNTTITPSATTGAPLQNTNVVFAVESGTGAGQYDNCPDASIVSRPIYNINGATANEYGDFIISADDCLFARRPTTSNGTTATPVHQTLAIGTNCQPCCDCADYVDVAQYMNRIAANYSEVGRRSHNIKLLHAGNIERWTQQRDCRLQRPLRVSLTPQNCPNLDVVLMYCNHCQQCATNVKLNVAFSTFPTPTSVSVLCGHTTITAPGYPGIEYALTGTYPNFTAELPPVDLGNSAYVMCRLSFAPKTTPHTVTATLTATQNDVPMLTSCDETGTTAEAVVTATLNCNSDGSTSRNC